MSVDMSSKIDELAHNIGEVINRADALMDKFEKNEGDIAGIEESLKNKADLLTQNLEWTVGRGGKFSNLNDAINEASKYYSYNGPYISIKLKTGYVIDRNIYVLRKDLSFVTITTEIPEDTIEVDANALANSVYANEYALFNFLASKSFTLACKFNIVGTLRSPSAKNYIASFFQSYVPRSSLAATNESTRLTALCNFREGSSSGIVFVDSNYADAYNNILVADNNSNVNVWLLSTNNIKSNSDNFVCNNSNISIFGAKPSSFVSTTGKNLLVSEGGIIKAQSAFGALTGNIAFNTVTSSGIIFK